MTKDLPKLPKDGIMTSAYMEAMSVYADGFVEDPYLTASRWDEIRSQLIGEEDRLAWRLARPYERFLDKVVLIQWEATTSENYLNTIIAGRRFQWVQRFFIQMVLDRRLGGRNE